MGQLVYDEKKADYFVDDWLAVCVLGPKALVQKRDGKKMRMGVFERGVVNERAVGTNESLGGPFRATSKGWKLDE